MTESHETLWDESVWAIAETANADERAELARVQATDAYSDVVKAGIPAEVLDVGLLHTIRTRSNVRLDKAWRDFKRAARKLREAAEAIEALAALPAEFAGYDVKADKLRTFAPFRLLTGAGDDRAWLRDSLARLAKNYDLAAGILRPEGRSMNYARLGYITMMDVVAQYYLGGPRPDLLAPLYDAVFGADTDPEEGYRRGLLKRARRRRGQIPCR